MIESLELLVMFDGAWVGVLADDAGWFAGFKESAQSVLLSGGIVLIAVSLVVVCSAAWLTNLVALPGNWLAVLAMGLYAWLGPESGRAQVGLVAVGAAFVAGLVGELIEFAAGAVGASRAGASRRGTIMAVAGSVVGAIVGGIIGLPIPVLGPVLAALLFGGMGATAGAMLAEWHDGKSWRDNWRIGRAAFWGRTTGVVGKMIAGLVIVLICVGAVLF
ncbi:DUF456 domain-containing protein [Aporhodopirellula aestuarii]|uniref:DUF456 domain-containing protein n=1 Tax=Aporhodopirellula aestuarii TaxID=2950107 RepID=A0ABT0U4N9_9BACT|nr:DUF456 domain-containing protein [Aporhodopirellula aestuarii]MCM2371408.1 DUF456 domain-containing protein [Aporhodopirellula aestuarii]